MECSEKPVFHNYTVRELAQLRITPPDEAVRKLVKKHWDTLAKPLDGMGSFETITAQIGAILGTEVIDIRKKGVLLFCADNGIVEEGVTQSGQEVTLAVAKSMARKGSSVCRMGCRFCASTLDGLVRGLRPSEMIDQIYQIGKDIGERISNVVVMGTGEPLDNYDNLLRFIELLTDENGINISQRNLTVSTCGLVPRMRQLADEKLSITLALSLHASNQEKRKALMPVANSYDIHDVVDACKYYFAQTGRRVTFEYSLVGGVNDTAEDAAELSALVHGMNCHINLIPVNPIKERDYVQSNKGVIEAFKNRLEKNGINVTIRREMGRDIDGACGQLRKKHIDKERGIN